MAHQIDWPVFDKKFGSLYAEKGRPGKPTRLMVGLHYLKHAFNESDESVVARLLENPYWQYFCGFEFFIHSLPVDPTSMTCWRKRIGPKNMEHLLSETLESAGTVSQSYLRLGKKALIMNSRYAYAQQMRRAKREQKKLKNYLGRGYRNILRNCPQPDEELALLPAHAQRILEQKRQDKNKLYSVHAPEVECIAKGKVHKKYEFGCKVSVVTTSKDNWVVGIEALHANPFDGHTLKGALQQMKRLVGWNAQNAYCDKGYKGNPRQLGDTAIHLATRSKRSMTRNEWRWFKRRSAIEPVIGHLKDDHRMDRNYLKGTDGENERHPVCLWLQPKKAPAGFIWASFQRAGTADPPVTSGSIICRAR